MKREDAYSNVRDIISIFVSIPASIQFPVHSLCTFITWNYCRNWQKTIKIMFFHVMVRMGLFCVNLAKQNTLRRRYLVCFKKTTSQKNFNIGWIKCVIIFKNSKVIWFETFFNCAATLKRKCLGVEARSRHHPKPHQILDLHLRSKTMWRYRFKAKLTHLIIQA